RSARLSGVTQTQPLPQSIPSAQTTALPPASVTEGTTELLGDAHAYAREKVHAPRQRGDTSPIN
ncbi:MAG TPA: hypothetical protein VKB12_10385, partial [Pyrinomonadaceae bacterium]|nr:hypothetical protein [Pyrinomonadaceae bacterium]